MIKKIKNFILLAVASSTLLAPMVVPALAGTAGADITGSLCQGVNNATSNGNGTGCGTAGQSGNTDLSTVASRVVNIFSIIVGIIAVVMIIYGGFRYITSGGDSGRVGAAKNSLIYAIVGLIIVALAQIIVHYVLNTVSSGTGTLT